MISTDNALDIAISGDGFFEIQLFDGTTAFTRDGSFKLSAEGEVVTAGGEPLIPQLIIPPNAQSITIGRDGTVSVELEAVR